MKRRKRMTALLLAGMLLFAAMPISGQAEENKSAEGVCEHHSLHDAECGYVEGTEGTECSHEHGASCYAEETNCLHTCTETCYPEDSATENEGEDACNHICSIENGCIIEALNCIHEKGEHDETCGYVPAVEGTPCGYICPICYPEGNEDGTEPDIPEDNLQQDRQQTEGQNGGLSEAEGKRKSLAMAVDDEPDDKNEYYEEDVKVINSIIEKNGLQAEKDSPAAWNFVTWDDTSPSKRIVFG